MSSQSSRNDSALSSTPTWTWFSGVCAHVLTEHRKNTLVSVVIALLLVWVKHTCARGYKRFMCLDPAWLHVVCCILCTTTYSPAPCDQQLQYNMAYARYESCKLVQLRNSIAACVCATMVCCIQTNGGKAGHHLRCADAQLHQGNCCGSVGARL